ncbi:PREDICTED: cytochrome b-c1 complex subunit 6, mitochondrial [Eufriesea mexicana]|uniref:cytochrome b-c1 complex subunit 6, mitochondrial n=1 Tax=Eufriesea mexicana TaxID=516756 RepID=UPI00083C7064|nr:PREDICTED: cytochrome b-c1 complex subunit 6, mitochondrial [Eufriesea mexicana]
MYFLQDFLKRYMPIVKAEEEELIDPQKVLRERCSKQSTCADLQKQLDTCNNRVNSKTQTEETCMEELLDYVECVDHCVAKTLFSKLE